MRMRSWWTGTWLVAARSLADAIRSKSVRVTTAVLLLVGLAVVFGPRLLDGEDTYTLATVGAAPADLRLPLQAAGTAAGFDVAFRAFPQPGAVEAAVRKGDAAVGVTATAVYVRSDAPGAFTVLVSQAVIAVRRHAAMTAAGLTPDAIAGIVAIAPPKQVEVGPAEDAGRAGVGFIIGIALYMALMFTGNSIAMNIGLEKSSRIAEVLLAVLRPGQILVGNVLGMGLQTLVQLLVLTVPILAALGITDDLELPQVAVADILLGVAWFAVGYLMYAFLFAAAAALVDKVGDVGSAIAPVTVILVLAYLGAVMGVQQDPASVLSVALSLFPLSSVMAMPVRWSTGLVPVWQLVVSLGLALVTAAALAAFAARVYQRALVVTGRRLRLRETLRDKALTPTT